MDGVVNRRVVHGPGRGCVVVLFCEEEKEEKEQMRIGEQWYCGVRL